MPKQPGFHKRRAKLTETIEWLIGVFAAQSPGFRDDLVLLDSTPVECARSLETVRRSALSDAAGYGYCRSHSRFFFGFRLHLAAAPDGTPRAAILAPADQPEREIALKLLPRALHGGELVIADKGYAGKDFEAAVTQMGATLLRPARKNEPDNGCMFRPIEAARSRSILILLIAWSMRTSVAGGKANSPLSTAACTS